MADVRVVWQGEAYTARLRAMLRARGQKAVSIIVGDTRSRISTAYPPASRPGQPPHRRTGTLMSSITGSVVSSLAEITLTIAATAPYAKILDPGPGRGVGQSRTAGGQFAGKHVRRRPFLGLPTDVAKAKRIMLTGA